MNLMVPFLNKKNLVQATVSNSRSILILSFHLLNNFFSSFLLVKITHVFVFLMQSTNFPYITILAFNYPTDVGNLGQQREQFNRVAMLWDDRGVVFRFPVGAKLFLVCKLSRPTHEPKQFPLYRVEGILSRGWSNRCLTPVFCWR